MDQLDVPRSVPMTSGHQTFCRTHYESFSLIDHDEVINRSHGVLDSHDLDRNLTFLGSFELFTPENVTSAHLAGQGFDYCGGVGVGGEESVGGGGGGGGGVAFVIKTVIVPLICAVGMAGNLLTLLVLSRKRLKVICDGIERTVHLGLRALAVSDLLLCVCLLPNGFIAEDRFEYPFKNFQIIYRAYSGALINTFILTSTWLTVTMATSRYLAICYPFKWHYLVGMTGTKASIALVFLTCLVFNIPRFFEHAITTISCDDGREMFVLEHGELMHSEIAFNVYTWLYFSIGIFLPLTALTYCNVCLVRTLRESSRVRQQYRVRACHVNMNHRITVILVTIVLMYILLVSPSEILQFIQNQLLSRPAFVGPWINCINLAVNITNVLQTINFSFNFVLYILLNFQFRRTIEDLFCRCRRRWCSAATKRRGDVQRVVFLARQMSLRTINSSVYSAAAVIY